MSEKMTEIEIEALVANEIRSATNYCDAELVGSRTVALEYHRGVMNDTPAMPGRSKVVSRDVADTISWIVPGIIRVFDASDKMAIYEPETQDDEEGAKQATDYIKYVWDKDNDGYRILWEATQDALLLGNGVVKHYWDETEQCTYGQMTGQTEQQIAMLMQDGVEITAAEKGEAQQGIDPATGAPTMIETYTIKTKKINMGGRLAIECIEPENFLMDGNARTMDECRFAAHRDEVSRSDLVKMGFDRETVENLPAYQSFNRQDMDTSRDTKDMFRRNDEGSKSETLIELYECYVKCDVDGDGQSETVRAYYAGNAGSGTLLDWEVWDDDIPFSDIPCEPVAHRWDARSITDKVMDIQRVNTVLKRQFLDNMYAVGLPLMEVEEGSVSNPEALTARKFGGVVLKKKGSPPIVPQLIPFVGDKILMGLEYMGQELEKRTGVSRASMALDPETLQNQSATANQNQKDASYSQIELIARNMAELGWRRVFRQLLKLVVKHQDRPRVIRLRDEWVEMDPRYWNANMDVSINVGLGTGSRDRDMQMLNTVLGTQMGLLERLQAVGLQEDALDMLQRVMKTAQKQAESSGLKHPDEYYPTIDDEDIQRMAQKLQEQAQQPPIELQLEQAKGQTQMQIEQAKVQAQGQIEQAKMQMAGEADARKSQIDVQKEAAQLEADLQTKEEDRKNILAIEDKKQQMEYAKLREAARQAELDRAQQLKIETLKIEAQAKAQAESHSHEGEQNRVARRGKQNELLISSGKAPVEEDQLPSAVKQMLDRLEQKASAPRRKQVVRDPETNRIVEVIETLEAGD